MAMYDNYMDILNVIRNDEILLRLLYYPPEDLIAGIEDPLSPNLPNILDFDRKQLKEIRDERIVKSAKVDDLVHDKKMCRLYVFLGRRRPKNYNYLVAEQEIIFDVFIHNDIENADLRSARVSDRLNELLVLKPITGLGKMDYEIGQPINAPEGFVAYRHVYTFGSGKR